MKDTNNFIETVVQLMRLTRENKIKWKRTNEDGRPRNTFSGDLNDLQFTLYELVDADVKDFLYPLEAVFYRGTNSPYYRLTVKDNRTTEEIVFP